MKYAFNLPNFGDFADARVLAEVAHAAEAGGWDGFFIWDHLSPVFFPGMLVPTADTTVALTAIALATSSIRFGPMVTPLPRRRVQKVAREFATLDHLSNGRVVLGVGLGVPEEHEYGAFGEPTSQREHAQVLDESLEVLTAIWSGNSVDYDGDHVHVHSVPLLPAPVQQPRIPIWVAARWPGRDAPFQRAARYDGIFPIAPNPDEEFVSPEQVVELRSRLERDDTGFDIVVNGGPEASPAAFERAGATWWIETHFEQGAALARASEGPPRT